MCVCACVRVCVCVCVCVWCVSLHCMKETLLNLTLFLYNFLYMANCNVFVCLLMCCMSGTSPRQVPVYI